VKPTRAQVVGMVLLGLAVLLYFVVRYWTWL